MGAVRGARHAAAAGQRVDRRARCDTHAAGELQRGGLLVGAAASVAAADGGRLRRPGGCGGGGRAFQIQRRAGDCCRAAGGRFTAGATTRFAGAGVALDAVGGRRSAGAARGVGVVELGAGDRRDAGKNAARLGVGQLAGRRFDRARQPAAAAGGDPAAVGAGLDLGLRRRRLATRLWRCGSASATAAVLARALAGALRAAGAGRPAGDGAAGHHALRRPLAASAAGVRAGAGLRVAGARAARRPRAPPLVGLAHRSGCADAGAAGR